jgi:hypothetical protein
VTSVECRGKNENERGSSGEGRGERRTALSEGDSGPQRNSDGKNENDEGMMGMSEDENML